MRQVVGRHLRSPYLQDNVKYATDSADPVVNHQQIPTFDQPAILLIDKRSGDILSRTSTVKKY